MTCDRCKRQLEGTVHTKDAYRVDLFRLWTGIPEPVIIKEEGEEETKYFKINEPRVITLCNKCISMPEIKKALQKYESPF